MNDSKRHIRQIPLIGSSGQAKLKSSHVVIVGIGALGSVAAELLVRSGVGQLTLIDRDLIELSNLQRQALFVEKDVSRSKVLAAKEHLLEIDSSIDIEIHAAHLDKKNIASIIPSSVDLLLDCTDTMAVRWLLNDYARKNTLPWIFSSVVASSGLIRFVSVESPCLKCHFPKNAKGATCAEAGVLAMSSHVIGSMQANLALRFLIDDLDLASFYDTLFSINLKEMEIQKFKVKGNKNCECCKRNFESLCVDNGANEEIVRFCSSGQYQIYKNRSVDLKKLSLVVKNDFEQVLLDEVCLRFGPVTVFSDGRALIKSKSKEEAVSLYDKYIEN